jgi:hypothetical protein
VLQIVLGLRGKLVFGFFRSGGRAVLVEDVLAELDALVADVDSGSGDQLVDLVLALPAEGASLAVTILAFVQGFLEIPALPGDFGSLRLSVTRPLQIWTLGPALSLGDHVSHVAGLLSCSSKTWQATAPPAQ